MSFRCPTCGADVQTRVLADPVTLVVVGQCDTHGVLELSRIYIGESPEVYPTEATTSSAYKPGACCGRRLGEHGWCHLPVDHQEPHAA
jgi:hypothetical protein